MCLRLQIPPLLERDSLSFSPGDRDPLSERQRLFLFPLEAESPSLVETETFALGERESLHLSLSSRQRVPLLETKIQKIQKIQRLAWLTCGRYYSIPSELHTDTPSGQPSQPSQLLNLLNLSLIHI